VDKVTILSPVKLAAPVSKTTASVNSVQPDLLYMDSVLVSTGQNKNDDVFLPAEMWAARATPILKPVDWEHNTGVELITTALSELKDAKKIVADNQIIGVMYNSYATLKDGSVIDEAAAASADFAPPKEFDIVNQAVIYKSLFPRVAERIVKQAAAGELFVSMEAWFGGYDYKVGSKIVARNAQTSFLDSSLRAYGGNGLYGSEPVSRVLRRIVFGGIGLVANPANADSVIQTFTNASLKKSELPNTIASHVVEDLNSEAIEIMSETNKEAVASITGNDYKEVVQLLAKAELVAEAKASELEATKAEVTKLTKSLELIAADFAAGAKTLAGVAGPEVEKLSGAELFTKSAELMSGKLEAVATMARKYQDERNTLLTKVSAMELEKRNLVRSSEIEKLLAEFVKDDKKKKERMDKMCASSSSMTDEAFASYLADTRDFLNETRAEIVTAPVAPIAPVTPVVTATEGITDTAILDGVKATASAPAGNDNVTPPVNLVDKYKALATTLLDVYKKAPRED
jgi:hypothetical protein